MYLSLYLLCAAVSGRSAEIRCHNYGARDVTSFGRTLPVRMFEQFMNVIAEEARAGFPRMRGARLRATIPIRQELIHQALGTFQADVQILANNRLLVSYLPVRIELEIVDITPDLTLVLSTSWLSRTALRGVLALKPDWKRYVGQRDGLIYVFGDQIPVVLQYRYLWQHVSEIRVRTVPGMLLLDVAVHIR